MGVSPDVYVGHSLGEITAAHLSGALSLDETARLVIHYSRLQATTDSEGTMAIVGLGVEAAERRLGQESPIVIAGHNGPSSVVLSGARTDLEPFLADMRAEGVFGRFIDVNVAAHSPRIDPIMDELRRELEPLRPQVSHTPMISTLWGREVEGPELGAEYWPQNLRERVRFCDAIDRLLDQGVTAFVELNPHPILVPSIRQSLERRGSSALVVESTRRGEDESRAMLEGLGRLFVTGHDPSRRARYEGALHRARARVEDPARLVGSSAIAVPLSGRSSAGLRVLTDELRARCELEPERSLPDVARGVLRCDSAFAHRRVAVLGADAPAEAAFERASSNIVSAEVDARRGKKVVFVCPGQGAQWKGMARDLLATQPVFYDAVARIDRASRPYMERSVLAELLDPSPAAWPIDVVQPLLFTIEVALGRLWSSWGLEPDAIVGHSMGEVAAYHLAGALPLDDALRVICRRSRLLARASGQGAMLAVELSAEQARELVGGREQHVAVAVANSPSSTVLSGDAEILEQIRQGLDERGIFCRFVKVDVASHSPQMDPLLDELRECLDGVKSRRGEIPVYSTVSGVAVDGSGLGPEYWLDNLRGTVRFAEAIQQLVADGHDLFIELSPHPILLAAVEQGIDASGCPDSRVLGSMRRGEAGMATMLEAVSHAYVLGHEPRWSKTISGGSTEYNPLVCTPWEREHYWLPAAGSSAGRSSRSAGSHPLLGEHLDHALDPWVHQWQLDLSLSQAPWLSDHRVHGSVVASIAVSAEMLLAALKEHGAEVVILEQLRLEHPLVLPTQGARAIQVALREEHERSGEGRGTLGVFSRGLDERGWISHVEGRFACRAPSAPVDAVELESLQVAFAASEANVDGFYRAAASRGLAFGPAFRAVQQLWVKRREALARVALPRAATGGEGAYRLHPVLLDGALQVVLAVLEAERESVLTVGVDRLQLFDAPRTDSLWSYVRVAETASSEIDALVVIYAGDGAVVARIEGLRLARVPLGAEPSAAEVEVELCESGVVGRPRREDAGKHRRVCFEGLVREQVGAVLKIDPGRVDPRRPLQAMGLTSLMTIELRNRLGALVGERLPSTLAWNYPTLEALLGYLSPRLPISLDEDEDEVEVAGRVSDDAPASPCRPTLEAVPVICPGSGLDAELLAELSRVDALLTSI